MSRDRARSADGWESMYDSCRRLLGSAEADRDAYRAEVERLKRRVAELEARGKRGKRGSRRAS